MRELKPDSLTHGNTFSCISIAFLNSDRNSLSINLAILIETSLFEWVLGRANKVLLHRRITFFRNGHSDQEAIVNRRWGQERYLMVGVVADELTASFKLNSSNILTILHGQGQSSPNIVDLMSILISNDHME